jgi:hypothetical protein
VLDGAQLTGGEQVVEASERRPGGGEDRALLPGEQFGEVYASAGSVRLSPKGARIASTAAVSIGARAGMGNLVSGGTVRA